MVTQSYTQFLPQLSSITPCHMFNYGGHNLKKQTKKPLLSRGFWNTQPLRYAPMNFICESRRSLMTPSFTPSINLKTRTSLNKNKKQSFCC